MTKQEAAVRSLSHKQREIYELICKTKHFRAEGPLKRTCCILFRLGLIKQNSNSDNRHDYVLDGSPVKIPVKIKLPSTKSVVEKIMNENDHEPEPVPRAKIIHPAPDHTNPSREDHINKWSSVQINLTCRSLVKVKCLNDHKMQFIMDNYQKKTAQDMADHLKIEKFHVILFCQANDIEPLQLPRKRKPKDDFHCIPVERKQRMASKNYHRKMDRV